MPTVLSILVISTLLALLFLLFYGWKKMGRGRLLKNLFREFKRKIWMTCGLGGTFFGLYFLFVWIGAPLIQEKWRKNSLPLLQSSPLSLLYDGLLFFICLSLMIYFIRMLIKYVYLTRGKDF